MATDANHIIDRPPASAEFLLERAARLRTMAGMPASVENQLLHVAFELGKRPAKLEEAQSLEGSE